MFYVGVDIGGTKGLVTLHRSLTDPTVLRERRFDITKGDFDADYQNLIRVVHALREGYQLDGIGLAVAGQVNRERTLLAAVANLPWWDNQPIVDMLGTEFGCPVVLGGDVEASALADALFGVAPEGDFAAMGLGTGLGTAFVIRHRGMIISLAGEGGHMRVSLQNGILCGCGQRGCLEGVINGIKNRKGFTPETLPEHLWHQIAELVALGIRNLVSVRPVDLVVLSGGVICKQEWLVRVIQDYVDADMSYVRPPKVELSHFGESAGSVGGLALLALLGIDAKAA
jgi:predicted NBD/HSP70 family sugar kinase